MSESVSKREKQDMKSQELCGPTTSSRDCGIDSQLCSSTEVSAFPKGRFVMSSVSWFPGEMELSSVLHRLSHLYRLLPSIPFGTF